MVLIENSMVADADYGMDHVGRTVRRGPKVSIMRRQIIANLRRELKLYQSPVVQDSRASRTPQASGR
jgi:hypothetical protein